MLETTVYNILTLTDPLNCEQLRIRTSLPVNKIMAALTMLEVKKLILPMPGGGYVRVR